METHRFLLNEAGAPIVYLRTPLLSCDVPSQLYADNWQANLKQVLRNHRELCLAIRIASPALARELTKFLRGEEVSARAIRKLFSYTLRASTRTTPFGLFAAVSRVPVGDRTTLQIETEMRTRTRVDMGWLGELIAQWREEPEFRTKIRVTINDAMLRRGDRYTAYHPLRTGRRGRNGPTYTPMTFTATEAVHFLEGESRLPVFMHELGQRLHEKYDEPLEECLRLLADLWEVGFFIDELGIDPTVADPSRDVLTRVEARDPGRGSEPLAVLDALAALDARPVSTRTIEDYDSLDSMQAAIVPKSDSASQTDAIRFVAGELASEILDDVRLMAQLMLRGPALALREYRKRFSERYEGVTREVPLLELIHPSFGLGAPAAPDHDLLPQELLERQTLVACEALRDGEREIVLDEHSLDNLLPKLEASRLAPSFDLGFEVLASSYDALQSGDYFISPGAFTYAARAGAALGRFAEAVGDDALSDIRAITSQLEAQNPDAIVAELVVSPSWSRGLNVSIRPVMHSHYVRVGLMSGVGAGETIPLDDLVVGLDEVGFYLRSVRLSKRVVLTESHVLNTSETAPTISRFLSLLAYDGISFPREYEWDCRVPFLPRVRHGRIILRKATWRFSKEALNEALASTDSFLAFAKHWSIPRFVELVSADNRLLVDTTFEIGIQLLRDHIGSGSSVTLVEGLCTPENMWLRNTSDEGARFRAEFIASFLRVAPLERSTASSPVVRSEERFYSPGSNWLYIKLYGDAHDEDRLIGTRIAPLLQGLVAQGAVERWYFVRYADPRDHLRVRMKVAIGARTLVSSSIFDLLASLTLDGTLDTSGIMTYEREVERYGGSDGMLACENVFSADAAHVLRHIESARWSDVDERISFAARSIVEMALECAAVVRTFDPRGFSSERAGLSDADRQSARTIKQQLGGERFLDVEMRSALRELATLAADGRLQRPLPNVFDSVIHMHANRCRLGEAGERRARTLARQVLQSIHHTRLQSGHDGSGVA